MIARPDTNSGGVSPCALPERETGLPPEPSPATLTPFGDRFIEANRAALTERQARDEQEVRRLIANFHRGRGMPVAPGLTPAQRQAHDSIVDNRAELARMMRPPALRPLHRDWPWLVAIAALLMTFLAGLYLVLVWP